MLTWINDVDNPNYKRVRNIYKMPLDPNRGDKLESRILAKIEIKESGINKKIWRIESRK
mgnify:FL=1